MEGTTGVGKKRPFPLPACAPRAPSCPPAGPAMWTARPSSAARLRRVCPREPRAPGSHAPAPPALSGVVLPTCLGLGERLQALRCEPGEHEVGWGWGSGNRDTGPAEAAYGASYGNGGKRGGLTRFYLPGGGGFPRATRSTRCIDSASGGCGTDCPTCGRGSLAAISRMSFLRIASAKVS
jgi:hypothetical protein